MGKRWVAARLDINILEELEKLYPQAKDRTERIESRLLNGGPPLFRRRRRF